MAWYMSRNDEMVVPQSQAQSEQSLSLGNSFQWEEGLSMCGKLPITNYDMWGTENKLVGDWLDYQLDGISGMDQTNDNFMTSFLEEDPPPMRNSYESFDNFQTNNNTKQEQSSRSNLKYLEVPSSMDWDKLEDSLAYPPYDTEEANDSFARNAPGNETNTSYMIDEQVDKDRSLEETALQEFKMAMTQLTDDTRISFRDALYRLAKNSRQQQSEESTDEEKSFSNVHSETSRYGKEEQTELQTNNFDRGVARLMFNELHDATPDMYVTMQDCHYSNLAE
ncbi:hypothetical protein ACHQM5_012935 [Ranunculus cassubicifolius]